jgi:NAD(P)-dependent dehydrogenase (short-subunit alcohol dehydrogenase family)
MGLNGKTVLITGGAVRVGRAMTQTVAAAGANVIVHYSGSQEEAEQLERELSSAGRSIHLLHADFSQPQAATDLMQRALALGPVDALVNSAAIFQKLDLESSTLETWNLHMNINLTAPFLLSQAFWKARQGAEGRIVNILDWRALRPGADHLPYTISKAALSALTRSLAAAMAPTVTVNGIAFGAILPPEGGPHAKDPLFGVPAGRWANLDEVGETLLFLLTGPGYITGEIIYLDGGRHLI